MTAIQINKLKKKYKDKTAAKNSMNAMALITNPQILFLDEPTLGLNVLARRELWSSIKALKGKVTIILTTHFYLTAAFVFKNKTRSA